MIIKIYNLMNNNYLKILKLIFKNNSLLRVLQVYECLNINLYGFSLEFGATTNKDKNGKNHFFFDRFCRYILSPKENF